MKSISMFSKVFFSMLLVGLCLPFCVQAQNWDQIIKSVASDRAADDNFGYSVAISGDYAIVGAYLEDEDAAGGAPLSAAGSAYIFKRTGTTWAQEAKIVASDRAADDNFGTSVAISGDYAIVGAYNEDENAAGGATASAAGSAYVFKRTGTTWAQEAKIVASDRAADDNFGISVAISGDYVLVGALFEDENAAGGATAGNAGSAYVFKRTGTTWAQEAKIVASDRATNDYFGRSVAISGDYAIVGAYNKNEDAAGGATASAAGSAYVFKRTGTTWAQEAKIVASDRATNDNFGVSVAISGDYAIVGAFREDENAAGGATELAAGSAYIFKRTVTTWAQEAKIVASDRASADNFGFSVAISGDYVAVGAYLEDENATGGATASNAGSAYVFKRTGTTWAQEAKIVASDRAASDRFGYSVAISGDYALVGAYQEDENAAEGATASAAGSAYFYQRTTAPTLTIGTPTNPTNCTTPNGSIAFTSTGITAGEQTLNYSKDGTTTSASVTVAANGSFNLPNLSAGTYSDFAIGATTATGTNPTLTAPALPTITLGTIAGVSTTAMSFSIPYTATTGSPNQYSLVAGTPAMSGFNAVSNQTFSGTSGTFNVTIPASAANTYNFNLTVRNSTTGCVSAAVPVALAVTAPVANGPSCSTFTNKTTANGLGNNNIVDVYAVGTTVYAATELVV